MTKKQKHQKLNKPDKRPENDVSIGTQASTAAALEQLMAEGVVPTLRNYKQSISDLLGSTDRGLALKLAIVYAAASLVEADDDEWAALCNAEEWVAHPKLKPKRTDPLRAVLRMAVGFDGKKADSSVHRYYKALQPLFAENVPASDVPIRIQQAGGIEKMRQWSMQISAPLGVTAELRNVQGEKLFKLLVKCGPPVDGVSNLEIMKVKRDKKSVPKKG